VKIFFSMGFGLVFLGILFFLGCTARRNNEPVISESVFGDNFEIIEETTGFFGIETFYCGYVDTTVNRILRFDEINWQNFVGAYQFDTILSGEIEAEMLGLRDLSELVIIIQFCEDTGRKHVFSNFPDERTREMNIREFQAWGGPRIHSRLIRSESENSEDLWMSLWMHFTENGIILVWGNLTSGVFHQYANLLLKTKPLKELMVVFDHNGGYVGNNIGNVRSTFIIPVGELIHAIPNPRKGRHFFDGWYTDRSFNNPFDPTVPIDDGLTIYAKWVRWHEALKFVTSQAGLRVRSSPFLDGEVVDLLYFGERIVIVKNVRVEDSIDGITDFWYKMPPSGWVFGGYLSDQLSKDAPVILGVWEDRDSPREIWSFRPRDSRFWTGMSETSFGSGGIWEFFEDRLYVRFDVHSSEAGRTDEINVVVADRNNITFVFSNGSEQHLTRSSSIYSR